VPQRLLISREHLKRFLSLSHYAARELVLLKVSFHRIAQVLLTPKVMLDELAEITLDGTRKEHTGFLVTVSLLILDDLSMRKLPLTAAEELVDIIMRRYEPASTMLTSNQPVEYWANCRAMRPREGHVRPPDAPLPCAQLRPAKLAHQNRLATTGGGRVEHSQSWMPIRWPVLK